MQANTLHAKKAFLFAGILVGIYLFFRFLLVPTLPFLAAFFFAYAAQKPLRWLERKYTLKRTVCVLLLALPSVGLVFFLGYQLTLRITKELYTLFSGIESGALQQFFSSPIDSLLAFLQKLSPALSRYAEPRLHSLFSNFDRTASTLLEKALPLLAENALSLARAFPKLFLSFGTFVLSFFYISCDYEALTGALHAHLSEKHNRLLHEVKKQIVGTVLSVLRAYTLLFLLTFSELAAGLLILKLPLALLIALFIALVDILPVFGAGTVLIPWGLAEFLNKNTKMGLCLWALYGIITVIRQAAEPKLVSHAVGMHPLGTLAAMYIGSAFFGVKGLFLCPIAAVILKNLYKQGVFSHLYRKKE